MPAAIKNLTIAMVSGCACCKAILVAVAADGHNMENTMPAASHLYCSFTIFIISRNEKPRLGSRVVILFQKENFF